MDCLPEVRHIVVLMMENHSFDNYFGTLGRGDGFTIDRHGKPTAANPDHGATFQFTVPIAEAAA